MAKPKASEARVRLIWDRIWEAASRHYADKEQRITQRVIAGDADVSAQLVNKWKKGTSTPAPETLALLADRYSCSLAWLSGQDVEKQEGEFSRLNDISRKAFVITQEMTEELLPEGSGLQYLEIAQRAIQLFLEGREDAEVRGILFEEVRQMKREGS